MFSVNASLHNYYTRQCQNPHIWGTRTQSSSRCIRHYIPNLLLELPNLITDKLETHNYQCFSNYVKTHLFPIMILNVT